MIDIKVIGADEIAQKFTLGGAGTWSLLGDAMESSLKYVHNYASIYPPETEANQPPPPYYVRGVGTQKTKTGNLGESQQLGSHWSETTELKSKTLTGTLSNPVTYASHVHLKATQRPFHAARGWRTVETITQEAIPQIIGFFEDAIRKVVQFLS